MAATEWHRIGRVGAMVAFIDRNSIINDGGTPLDKEGDLRKVHVLFSYDDVQHNFKRGKFFSESFVDEISCSKRTVTSLSTVQYAGGKAAGAVVHRHKIGVRLPQPILPGTLNDHIMKAYVCGLR